MHRSYPYMYNKIWKKKENFPIRLILFTYVKPFLYIRYFSQFPNIENNFIITILRKSYAQEENKNDNNIHKNTHR